MVRATEEAATHQRLAETPHVSAILEKSNGKWTDNAKFPGREFDDLDAYRAAKKQRMARRGAYADQLREFNRTR